MRGVKRNRLREIEFEKIVKIQECLGFKAGEIAELLGVSYSQLVRYRRCGRLPANRYYGMKDALYYSVEERAREEREQINKLFE